MSTKQGYEATLPFMLEQQIMDPNVPKNEREWWASSEISKLRSDVERLKTYNNTLTFLCDSNLSSRDMKAVDRHCDWVAFGHAYRAMLNDRRMIIKNNASVAELVDAPVSGTGD